jgi:hypothetical protein
MSKAIVEIKGFDELQAKIKKLANPKDKKREVLAILRNVAKSTVRAARGYAPVSKKSHVARGKTIQPGTLKKSIGNITGRKGSAKINPTIYVGPRAKGRYNGWYGHFVETGVNVYRKGFKRIHKRGANDNAAVRRTKGAYYMKRAYQATGGRVTKEAEKTTARFIQRRINKLSK